LRMRTKCVHLFHDSTVKNLKKEAKNDEK
jgi:hypothetical protein